MSWNRNTAWEIVTAHVSGQGLKRHLLAVEAALRHYAEELSADPELWGVTGLLHDYDWEIHPTLEAHPKEGIPLLRERGFPEDVLHAILAHNPAGTGVFPETVLDHALWACDEITGLVMAAALVRPSKDVRDVELASLQKRWKERSFAAGVDRAEVERATEAFSRVAFAGKLGLWEHISHVLAAMKGCAAELELDGRMVQGALGPS